MQAHSGLLWIHWTHSTLSDSTTMSSMKSTSSFLTFITHFSLTPQRTWVLPSPTKVSSQVSRAKTTTWVCDSLSISLSTILSSREWCKHCQKDSLMPLLNIKSYWKEIYMRHRVLRQSFSMLLSILTDQIYSWDIRDRKSVSSCYLRLQQWETPFKQMVHLSLEWESWSKPMTAASS